MRNWSVGYNYLYREGHIHLEEGPWWLFFIRNIDAICELVPRIPLPPIPYKIDEEDDNTGKLTGRRVWTNLSKEWGNLHVLFHCKVCAPVWGWANSKIKEHDIDAPLAQIEERFYDKSKHFNREEDKQQRDEWVASIKEEDGIDLSNLERFGYRELEAMRLFAKKLKQVQGASIDKFYRGDQGELHVMVDIDAENTWEAVEKVVGVALEVDESTGIFINLE